MVNLKLLALLVFKSSHPWEVAYWPLSAGWPFNTGLTNLRVIQDNRDFKVFKKGRNIYTTTNWPQSNLKVSDSSFSCAKRKDGSKRLLLSAMHKCTVFLLASIIHLVKVTVIIEEKTIENNLLDTQKRWQRTLHRDGSLTAPEVSLQ